MPITLANLERTARVNVAPLSTPILESKQARRRSAFLCHSHRDRELVQGLVVLLAQAGLSAYVDWADAELPSTPDRQTAAKIKTVIEAADLFLFLATPQSMASRWCPWEIGYADGVKPINNILIVPTADSDGRAHGNEYLQLYRRIDADSVGTLKFYNPGSYLAESLRIL